MSCLAIFSFKDPSLLKFNLRREAGGHKLSITIRNQHYPSDSSMPVILDAVSPAELQLGFKDIFRSLQRGKLLEKVVFMEGCYLRNLDSTGYFSSPKRYSPSCLQKVNSKTGEFSFYLPRLGTAIV